MIYATLQAAIAEYMHRSDLATKIPTFISVAESSMFRDLDIKNLQVSVAGTTTGAYVTLPVDFGSVARLTVTYGGRERNLDYKALPDASTATSPTPSFYSFENNKLIIWGAGTGQAYTLYYTPYLQPLSDTNTTNWLLDNAFDLYLYSSCLEAAKNIRDDNEVQKLTSMVAPLIASVQRHSERRGQPTGGSLQIKPRP
jgi:hypothetical protein